MRQSLKGGNFEIGASHSDFMFVSILKYQICYNTYIRISNKVHSVQISHFLVT